ncbi:MAG: hypothetical protein COB40_09385, partial [Marinosulfonomonas sp.]
MAAPWCWMNVCYASKVIFGKNDYPLYDPSMNSANLALRFLLELSALTAFAMWTWGMANGLWRFVYATLVIVVLATIWGAFAVPDDPSRSGGAPVP